MRTRVVLEEQAVVIPGWVNDLESFRRWADDDSFPEEGRIAYLRGRYGSTWGRSNWFRTIR